MRTFETPSPVTLSIELDAGDVTIDATTTTATEIALRPVNPGDQDAIAFIEQAEVTQHGDRIVVHLPLTRSGLFRRSPEIALRVGLPVGSTLVATLRSADLRVTGELNDVRVETASGDVRIDDVAGSAVVTTASGDVTLATVGGPVEVRTASGEVRVETSCADCSVQTASGDVTLGVVEGELKVKTASGDVVVRAAEDAVRARTASGDVQLRQLRSGTAEVDTVSGDIEIGVERDISVYLDVSSLSGDISSSLQPADAGDDSGHTVALHVKTLSGDVQLRSV